ncbi:Hsp20/alpha crystallin family protein [Xenophilus sp. Marseille-Q4582]|uniref:Hsp20/alpha crystallin family protein n=1 Tax=Xenophilus sp. Marseille-Q4582 TaxID=2866600 RepID=UPI001CE3C016|nr:Hsp20/alpha crystallin family protein [Xenophilus sp. Marseille-Q4582]
MNNEVTNTAPQAEAPRDTRTPAQPRHEAALTPPVDVVEDAGGITLYADMPGVNRDRLNLQIESDTLTLEGVAELDLPAGLNSHHSEVSQARYHRVFTLSKELDTANISAVLNQGVLKLRIPKAAHAQPRRIQVEAA